MNTKETIEKFCLDFGYKPINSKAEYKELPNIVKPEETLIAIIEGVLKNVGHQKVNGGGILLVSNQRLLFYRKSFIGTITTEEYPIKQVTTASYRKGLMSSEIVVTASNNNAILDLCDKKQGEKTVAAILSAINNTSLTTTIIKEDAATRIEKLFELKQKGILTEDEFSQQKVKILSE